jgi:hypothetical protein
MNLPRLFLSAVSEELRSARQSVAATVRTLGFEPVSQDDFPTDTAERQNKAGEAKAYWKEALVVLSGIEKRGLHLEEVKDGTS